MMAAVPEDYGKQNAYDELTRLLEDSYTYQIDLAVQQAAHFVGEQPAGQVLEAKGNMPERGRNTKHSNWGKDLHIAL